MTNHPFRVLLLVAASLAAITVATADDPPAGKSRAPFRSRAVPKERPQRAPGQGGPAAAPQPGAAPAFTTLIPESARRAPTGPAIDVTPLDPARRPEVNAAAALIDGIIDRTSPAAARAADAPLDDALFARRVYLNLGGRIPSTPEMVAFMGSKSPRRREELVDAILSSPDWASHAFNLWANTLRLKDQSNPHVFYSWPYLDWVKRSLAANRPYDEWVREMLTADGKAWDNPAVGYQLRDQGMPLNYVDHTVRVFLGTQIGCAQCHDHPFDDWKQRQFFEIAAFTAGIRTGIEKPRMTRQGGKEPPTRLRRNFDRINAEAAGLARDARERKMPFEGAVFGFLEAHRRHVDWGPSDLLLPHDYRYDDGSPGDVVEPRVPWGEEPPGAGGLDPRRRFAAWLTAADNRQFARTVANRLWKDCFGLGIVEPVDDFRDGNPPSNPDLLDHLAGLMVDLGFDTREFVRIVVSTQAWQRRAVPHDPSSANPYPFRAPLLRRMSAEQLWDSLLTLVSRDIWAYQRPKAEAYAMLGAFDLGSEDADFKTAYALLGRFREASLMWHEIDVHLHKHHRYRDLYLARASELPQPARMGHLLREFGQGDRETIDGARTVATLPQVLTMFHGYHGQALIDDGSAIMQSLLANDPDRGADVAFIGILSRPPTAADRETVSMVLHAAPTALEGFRDIVWALVNTREFLFIQ
ncbi:MAG: DUF1549 domain-containing protein [Planctomycetaceae bacterium]